MASSEENKLYLTNNYSIISKYSASKLKYFKDELLENFIEKFAQLDFRKRRTPLVNRGYAARLLALEWAVSRAVTHDRINCFIVLGSGFDMLPQRYLGDCHWIEIDLPEVIETKCKFIQSHWNVACESTAQNIRHFPSLFLTLISCDLRDQSRLLESLNIVLRPIRHECRRVSVLNEVCLCYSDILHVKSILETVVQSVEKFCWQLYYIGYEQVKFDDRSQFSDIMLDHFAGLGHPLRYFPNQIELKNLFESQLKFHHITVASMYQIYHNALMSETLARNFNILEPFDEYEDMDLYLGHYALVTGVRIFESPYQSITPKQTIAHDEQLFGSRRLELLRLEDFDSKRFEISKFSIKRFGHAACPLIDSVNAQQIFITGGFGADHASGDLQHKRLNDCCVLTRNDEDHVNWVAVNLNVSPVTKNNLRLDRVHGQVCTVNKDTIFIHGGRQSPTAKSAILANAPILCRLDGEANKHLELKHLFDCKTQADLHYSIRWRHRLIQMDCDTLIVIGGIGPSACNVGTVQMYNLNSGHYGRHSFVDSLEPSTQCFHRHSFGADKRDSNTFLLFGGLKASDLNSNDQPVDREHTTVLCDMRCDPTLGASRKAESEFSAYNCDINFISDTQFVKIGGVSTLTGLQDNKMDLYDLRSSLGKPVERKSMPTHDSNSNNDKYSALIWTNFVSCHFKSSHQIHLCGGGGNYFTFGTHFNRSQVVYKYQMS